MNRKEWIEAVKTRADILKEIGDRIELKKSGENYLGLCPYHDDVNPSLVVTPGKRLWNCLGCPGGANGRTGGSVIDFVMLFDKLSFDEAVRKLGARYGIAEPNGNGNGNRNGRRPAAEPARTTPREPRRDVSLDRRKKLLGRALEVYHREYLACDEARAYVERERAVLGSLVARHRIGYSSGSELEKLVPHGGDVREDLTAIGLLNARGRERFQGRIVFGLLDADGEVVGMIGRALGDNPLRYMALPEPFLGVFNRTCLGSSEWVVLVEGIFDALALESIGYGNVAPLCGKALRDEVLSAIRVAGVRQVVVLLDAGEAEASKVVAERLVREVPGIDVQIAALEEGDPSSIVASGGSAVLRSVIEGARKSRADAAEPAAPSEGVLELVCATRRYVVEAIENKSPSNLRVVVKAYDGPRFHLHTFNLKDSKHRKAYERDVAMHYRIDLGVVAQDMQRLVQRVEDLVRERIEGADKRKKVEVDGHSRDQAIALGRSADVLGAVVADARKIGVVGEEANLLAMYLLVTSRKMADPLSILFLSGSGSGKSLVQDRMLSFCPEEDLILVTALTGRSLFYREKSLRGKVLAIREETGAESAGYAIRALISDKELVVEATIKDPLTGRLTTMTNRVEGPPAVSVTSASPKTDPETLTRFLVLSIDESVEQTEKILEYQRQGETLDGLLARKERERIVEAHRAFQRLLSPIDVVNPFAELLTYPVRSLRARRSQPMYLALIRTVAFIHQMKKEKKRADHLGHSIEYLEVDLDDIRAAHRLAHQLLGGTLEDLSDVGRKLLDEVDVMVTKREASEAVPREEVLFTRRDVREWTGRGDFQVRTYLAELVGLEYVVPVHTGQGRRTVYRLDYRGEGAKHSRFALGLVEPAELERRARERGLLGGSGREP